MKLKRKEGCEDVPLPRYMSDGASGMDLYAAVEGEVVLNPGGSEMCMPVDTKRKRARAAAWR